MFCIWESNPSMTNNSNQRAPHISPVTPYPHPSPSSQSSFPADLDDSSYQSTMNESMHMNTYNLTRYNNTFSTKVSEASLDRSYSSLNTRSAKDRICNVQDPNQPRGEDLSTASYSTYPTTAPDTTPGVLSGRSLSFQYASLQSESIEGCRDESVSPRKLVTVSGVHSFLPSANGPDPFLQSIEVPYTRERANGVSDLIGPVDIWCAAKNPNPSAWFVRLTAEAPTWSQPAQTSSRSANLDALPSSQFNAQANNLACIQRLTPTNPISAANEPFSPGQGSSNGDTNEYTRADHATAGLRAKAESNSHGRLKCDYSGCHKKSFGRGTELRRHTLQFHSSSNIRLSCPAKDCKHIGTYALVRKDKLKEHIIKHHTSRKERALREKWLSQIDHIVRLHLPVPGTIVPEAAAGRGLICKSTSNQ